MDCMVAPPLGFAKNLSSTECCGDCLPPSPPSVGALCAKVISGCKLEKYGDSSSLYQLLRAWKWQLWLTAASDCSGHAHHTALVQEVRWLCACERSHWHWGCVLWMVRLDLWSESASSELQSSYSALEDLARISNVFRMAMKNHHQTPKTQLTGLDVSCWQQRQQKLNMFSFWLCVYTRCILSLTKRYWLLMLFYKLLLCAYLD